MYNYSARTSGEVYYAAYGSNLDVERMKRRCPGAKIVGTAAIRGYRLLFKRSLTGCYATIEQDANCCVPVLVYRMTDADEERLDRYEGYPRYYYKMEFLLSVKGLNGKRMKEMKNCVAYVMHEYRLLGCPEEEYFEHLDLGYSKFGFDRSILEKAVDDSIGTDSAEAWLGRYYGGE